MIWPGVVLGLIGAVGMLAAFPVYPKFFHKAKGTAWFSYFGIDSGTQRTGFIKKHQIYERGNEYE